MPYFGQDIFEQAEAKGPLTDKAYLDALAKCAAARADGGIDARDGRAAARRHRRPDGRPGVGDRSRQRRSLQRRQFVAGGGRRLPEHHGAGGRGAAACRSACRSSAGRGASRRCSSWRTPSSRRRSTASRRGSCRRSAPDAAHVDHPALHRCFHWDLAEAPAVLAPPTVTQADPARAWVARIAALYNAEVRPRLSLLPAQAIHNDANDYNVLVAGNSDPAAGPAVVTGLLKLRRHGVVGARARPRDCRGLWRARPGNPLAAAAAVVRGYHAVVPLSDDGIAVLHPLVLARWGMSLCHAAEQVAARPDNAYLQSARRRSASCSTSFPAVHERFAEYRFRDACGLAPCPSSVPVARWLEGSSGTLRRCLARG